MSDSIWSALRARFPSPEYAYLPELRNGTGFSRSTTRSADAVAFSLWPSRGLELHGIEVKVHRSDWLREKKNPAKAEEIGQFCERWWLATTEKVVFDLAEVPAQWGWLEWDGKKLKTRRDAPVREAKPLDRPLMASIFRNVEEQQARLISDAVQDLLNERMEKERETERLAREKLIATANDNQRHYFAARRLLSRIEQLLGESLTRFDESLDELPESVAERLRAMRSVDLELAKAQMRDSARELRTAAAMARRVLRSAGIRAEPKQRRYG